MTKALVGIALVSLLTSCASPAPTVVEPTPGVRAFVGARLVIGTPGATTTDGVIENGTLVMRAGRIESVGAADTTDIPPDAEVIDVAGSTIIPGLINAHGHVNDVRGLESDPAFYTEDHVVHQLKQYARYGVTTVLSLGGGGPAGVTVRDRSTQELLHARLYLSGPVVTADSPEAARQRVDEVAGLGVDIIKIRVDDNLGTSTKMPPETYAAVIDQAHERGLRVAAHVYYLDDAKGLLNADVDFIAHSVRDQEVDTELATLLTERDVCYCPTLMREVSTFVYAERPEWFDDPFFLQGVDPAVVQALEQPEYQEAVRNRPSAQVYKEGLGVAQRNLKQLADQGVRIAMGTDTGPAGRFQGYFEHGELELMAEAGLTPLEIIASATGEAARCLQVETELGTLSAGKWADFIVLSANPLDDIRNTHAIESVWIAGQEVPGSYSGLNLAQSSRLALSDDL